MFQELFYGAAKAKKVLGPYGRMLSVKKNRNGRHYIEYTSKRTGNKVRKYLDTMKFFNFKRINLFFFKIAFSAVAIRNLMPNRVM